MLDVSRGTKMKYPVINTPSQKQEKYEKFNKSVLSNDEIIITYVGTKSFIKLMMNEMLFISSQRLRAIDICSKRNIPHLFHLRRNE